MESIDALADAIEEFEGGVVIISHDARLLQRVCEDESRSEVWIVEDGQVKFYKGDFEDYRNELIAEITEEMDRDEAELEREKVESKAKEEERRKGKKEARERRDAAKAEAAAAK